VRGFYPGALTATADTTDLRAIGTCGENRRCAASVRGKGSRKKGNRPHPLFPLLTTPVAGRRRPSVAKQAGRATALSAMPAGLPLTTTARAMPPVSLSHPLSAEATGSAAPPARAPPPASAAPNRLASTPPASGCTTRVERHQTASARATARVHAQRCPEPTGGQRFPVSRTCGEDTDAEHPRVFQRRNSSGRRLAVSDRHTPTHPCSGVD